jgi:hypothetical protein
MKRHWIGGLILVCLGVLIGVIGQRTLWFGLARRHLRVEDCQAIVLAAPYEAWHLRINRDGSAVLAQGVGRNDYDVGFNPISTAFNLNQVGSYPEVRCDFPKGTFDFPTLCRELFGKRQTHTQGRHLDYPEMSWRVQFVPGPHWHDPAKQGEFRHEETKGLLAPAEGQQVIESLRSKALELDAWDKRLEDLWPYPPIPWGFNGIHPIAVPGKLRVQLPVILQQSWEGFLRDEKLQAETPPGGDAIAGPNRVGFVIDEPAWAKLWTAWRGEEIRPKVDFEKDIVLVFAVRGWNKLRTPLMPLDGNGDITALTVGTESQGGDGFAYLLGTVPRDRIKSVNKLPLGKR